MVPGAPFTAGTYCAYVIARKRNKCSRLADVAFHDPFGQTSNRKWGGSFGLVVDGDVRGLALRDRGDHELGEHRAAVSIGTNPHYGGTERRIEPFLLDFDGDLYGRELEVGFHSRLREVRKFADIDALRAQIAIDITAAERELTT